MAVKQTPLLTSGLVLAMALTACSTPATKEETQQNDPWQGMNRGTQSFNDTLDKAIIKPVAQGYQEITPEPVDESVTNFFSNLQDIGVTFNDLMQFKLLQGSQDATRFLLNSTFGLAGLFDVASSVDLPKHKEDFGQTLGFWGVPTGPYLVLPLAGPSTPREFVGLLGDALLNPLTYVSAFGGFVGGAATAGANVVDVTDTRADLLSTEKVVDEGSAGDRYSFMKNSYLQHREHLVHDGNVPENEEFQIDQEVDELDRDTDSKAAPAGSAKPMAQTPVKPATAAMAKPAVTPVNTDAPLPPVLNSTEAINKERAKDQQGLPPVVDHSQHFLNLSAPAPEGK